MLPDLFADLERLVGIPPVAFPATHPSRSSGWLARRSRRWAST
jgi:hypothetical protein